jgi:hypothetical protein
MNLILSKKTVKIGDVLIRTNRNKNNDGSFINTPRIVIFITDSSISTRGFDNEHLIPMAFEPWNDGYWKKLNKREINVLTGKLIDKRKSLIYDILVKDDFNPIYAEKLADTIANKVF